MKNQGKEKIDCLLLNLIERVKQKDCSFILNTLEYKLIKQKFLEYFNDNDIVVNEFHTFNRISYQIGDYIVKFGGFYIPNTIDRLPQLVNIYYRENFEIRCDDSVIFLGFEIQEFIPGHDRCSYDEIYDLYKSLRNMGYIWVDANFSNVKKKNGKALIIDSEYIYRENEVDYFNQSKLSKELEERYMSEIS